MKYEYRTIKVKGVPAKAAYAELERIREKRGITAKNVLDESRPKNAVLHPAFTWDDKRAAEEHRLWQARQLVRSVVVVSSEGDRDPVYVHVQAQAPDNAPGAGGGGGVGPGTYERVDVVVESPYLFERALSELRAKLQSAVQSVHELERAAKLSKDPDKMMRVSIAIKALDAAQTAITALH